MSDIGAAAELWRARGWALIPELVPSADIDRAVEQLWDLYPAPEQFHTEEAAQEKFEARSYAGFSFPDNDDEGAAFRAKQFLGHTMFPYSSPLLNRLNVHPNVVDFAKRAIGHDQLRIYQARIWGKYTGVVNYEQPFHQDRNHNVVPDRLEDGWWNLEGFLYLTDVDEGVAPTSVLGTGSKPPETQPFSAEGPRGSYLAYRPDVWHRGVDLTRPRGSRFLMNISFKRAGHDWIGYDSVQPVSTRPDWIEFASNSTPEELALFGAPEPGHDYWTPALVDALEKRYPGLDVSPWREALTKGATS